MFIDSQLSRIDQNPDLTAALDSEIRRAQTNPGGEKVLTLDDYRTVIPLLKRLEQMPEFADPTGKPLGTPLSHLAPAGRTHKPLHCESTGSMTSRDS
jgi:hypothetical protein